MERWGGRHNNAQSCQRRRQNPRQKWKNCECVEEQDNKSTYSFQNYVSSWYLMFLYQGWYLHKEKDTSFLTLCMANFGSTANSLFKIWTPARSSARTSRFHKNFFPSLDKTVLFLSSYGPFFFSFYQGLSSAFDFSMSKDLSISKELPRCKQKCAMYTKYGNNAKNEPQDERLPAKIPPRDSPRSEIMTPSWFIYF